MYALGRSGSRRSINIWPGFVDGLATLLLVVMFVLMVFMIAQYFLSTALSGRDEALARLNREVDELAELLALERAANADLRINVAQLSSELQSSIAQRETLSNQISALLDERESTELALAQANEAKDSLTAQLAALVEERETLERLLAEAEAATSSSREELEAAYRTIEADRETIEAQLADLAILKSLNDEMVEKLAGMEEALLEQEGSVEFLQAQIAELEASLMTREELLAALRLETDSTKQDLAAQRDRAAELEAALDQSKASMADLQSELSRSQESERDLTSRLTQSEEAEQELAARLARAEQALREQNALLAALRAQMNRQEQTASDKDQELSALAARIEQAEAEARRREQMAVALRAQLTESEAQTAREKQLTKEAQARINLLNRQIAALRQQLARLAATLETIEAENAEKDVRIADLGRRLNVALATKVQELARYRSEFFGRLREVLGRRQDIRVVGDRFVFQSELLFETGSAELGAEGREQIARLAETLIEIAAQIPPDIDWILRVDGHTDKRPIFTAEYRSNWALSTARALSVVDFLTEQGIPPTRLAATGFGEHHPLDPGDSEASYRRNRRIELKFTQK